MLDWAVLIPWPHSSTGTVYWTIPRGRGKRKSGASRDRDDQDAQFKLAFYEALDDPEVASKLARIISKANKDLVEHISTLRQEVRSLRSSLQELDATNTELRSEVQLLHDDLDALEQHGRRHSLRISGISMTEEDITAAVVKLANEVLEIAPPLSTKDISVSHRLRKPRNARPLLSCASLVGLTEIGWSGNARSWKIWTLTPLKFTSMKTWPPGGLRFSRWHDPCRNGNCSNRPGLITGALR